MKLGVRVKKFFLRCIEKVMCFFACLFSTIAMLFEKVELWAISKNCKL